MLGGSLTELMNHIVPYDYGYGRRDSYMRRYWPLYYYPQPGGRTALPGEVTAFPRTVPGGGAQAAIASSNSFTPKLL